MKHRATCLRGWYDEHGRWRTGDAPCGFAQWHSATCETPEANAKYARTQCIAAAPSNAEPFIFDTIPTLEERAARYGLAMAEWLRPFTTREEATT